MAEVLAQLDRGSTDRFGYEWSTYHQITPEYEEQFLKWVYPLNRDFFKDKTILDAGCGMGRNSYWPLWYGAKAVDAFDFDHGSVAAAQRNLAPFQNAAVYHQSIYDLDTRDTYDLAFSIGVIHHLERPREAVRRLFEAVRPGGKVLVWVYGYEGNEWIVRYINPIRALTSRLPVALVNILAGALSVPLYAFLKIKNHKHPYFAQLAKFKYWHVHSIVFDQLIPHIANYWRRDQALALFAGLPVKNLDIYRVNNNSWTVIAEK